MNYSSGICKSLTDFQENLFSVLAAALTAGIIFKTEQLHEVIGDSDPAIDKGSFGHAFRTRASL